MELAAEVLGKFGVCRESRVSVAATKLPNLKYPHPVLIGPFAYRRFLDVGRLKMSKSGCSSGMDTMSVGEGVFSVTSSSQCDVDYLGQSTKGDLNLKVEHLEVFGIFLFTFSSSLSILVFGSQVSHSAN
ncbi:hypothetical protein SLEP1_g9359 [Rubroshorea leprosula]|uniref:Uncharacterized protein n=1 Tax=Rubroshorea leprosula TaxID=152421 RepID=A0AAV5IAL2_9ROSI|nr:hypothetical protein SLEP1_g9359 [Rubroshorea leprosula]